ncbi:MAG TPA: dihydrodipicolinate synthase family protein [Chryseosolibacter sp.]|nr:dihydrodipicolinate synthase family protein [Chryseosolibacter sp.]
MSRYNVEILPAVFTPMFDDGSVHYVKINALYQRCIDSGYHGIFLNGTTGECMSLSTTERKKLVEAWVACRHENNNPDFKIFVHVGTANLYEACEMAEHAQAEGADGIAMVSTFYFRPKTLADLIDQCKYVASAAPQTPFYYYNIPSMTGVNFPLASFIAEAAREIPTFAGLKNSFNDLVDYQSCLHQTKGDYKLYWGSDEVFMMVYAGGNRHYVGSTYNYMGDIYFRMLDAYHAGNFEKLTTLEAEATRIYSILNDYNSLVAGKEIMRQIGIDCGPVRKPLKNLKAAENAIMVQRLRKTSFFDTATATKSVKIERI